MGRTSRHGRCEDGLIGRKTTVGRQLHPQALILPERRRGLLDMAGNVWQWTSANAGDGKREVRGGSWDNPPDALRTSKRLAWPENADAGMGFRCVKD
jgi:formylglycine-generating enzyme required for sulfatase activity